MQDGSPAHCPPVAKEFLVKKIRARVISSGADIAWSDHSLDLNPLVFHYWPAAQQQVYAAKPSTLDELINVANQYSAECSEEVLKNVALNAAMWMAPPASSQIKCL